jgi:DNA polymerase/3'-5' exonuclease PolX
MSTGTRLPLQEALVLARELVALLSPACERIQIAGSIRRHKPDVGDIELVMIPKIQPVSCNLFGEESVNLNLQFALVMDLIEQGVLSHRRDIHGRSACGDRMQRLLYKGVATDLFCVLPPAQWGVILAIRTGPAEMNRRIVTQQCKGGSLPNNMSVGGGQLFRDRQPVPTAEEWEFFEAIGMPVIPPKDRR